VSTVLDVIIWLGDLNYRLVSEMDISKAYELIEANDLAELYQWDQLNIEREENRVFQSYDTFFHSFTPFSANEVFLTLQLLLLIMIFL